MNLITSLRHAGLLTSLVSSLFPCAACGCGDLVSQFDWLLRFPLSAHERTQRSVLSTRVGNNSVRFSLVSRHCALISGDLGFESWHNEVDAEPLRKTLYMHFLTSHRCKNHD